MVLPLFHNCDVSVMRNTSDFQMTWKPWHSGSTIFQNAPCSETMAFWAECPPVRKPRHSGSTVFQNAPCLNRGHSEKQYSQNAMVSVSSVSLLSKNTFHLEKSGTNQLIMLKFHLFPRDSWKDAVLGPPKLPSGLWPLGSFGVPRPASFQESLGKRRNFGPKYLYHSDITVQIC